MIHRLHLVRASTTKNIIFAAFIAKLTSSPRIATTGIHQRYVIKQPFDNNITGSPQQIVDNANAVTIEVIKSATFACVERAN
jgi:hypothetical protein